MQQQFEGLPMEELIGAPLVAAANAQGKLSMQTAEFIKDVGINSTTNEVEVVNFKYNKVEKKNGKNEETTKVISVPKLAIVNIPSLKVKKVNIDFEMEIKQKSKDESKTEAELKAEFGYKSSFSPFSAKITGSVSTSKQTTRSTDNSAKYSVKVEAEDDGMPEGLSRVLTMLSNIIVEKDDTNDTNDTT